MKIEIKRLNKGYESDPNVGVPLIKINDSNLTLSFKLNNLIFNNQAHTGSIDFIECLAFREGTPNDEGFFLSDNSLWNNRNFDHIDWNSFYEVINTPLDYFEKFYRLREIRDLKGFHHYVFFMKEGTFECVASSYKENLN